MNADTRDETLRRAPSLVERTRIIWYLSRVDWRLSMHGMGWSRRVRIYRELKSNVFDAVAHHDSLGEAFASLGSPRELAAAYADAEVQRGFLHVSAAGWALGAFAILQVVGLGVAVGFRHGADAAGADEAVSYAIEFFSGSGPFSGSYTPGPIIMAEFTLLTPAHLVIMVVAGLIGGRVWRLLPRR